MRFRQDGTCKAEYKICEISDINEENCKKINPLNKATKCVWESGSCKGKRKTCKEIGIYSGIDCTRLETSETDMICVSSNDGCKEQYKNCDI